MRGGEGGSADPAPFETRRIYFSETGDFVATPVYARAGLGAGAKLDGPAVIEEEASTTLLLPGDRSRRRRVRQSSHPRRVRRAMNGDRPRVDPVVTELVRNGVIAITEEMKTNLTRTAYNMIIYEALDFTVGPVHRRRARRCRSGSGCRCSSAAWPRR